MANKVPSSTSIMLAVVALGYGLPLLSQTRQQPAGGTELQHRCVTVALTSDTPMLPVRLIEPYLEKRDDFQASRLLLSHDPAAADALVTLSRNGEAGTRIAAANRVTGQGVSAISGWTDHPGMVALFIMDQLRQVCPGAIVAQPKYRAAHHQCAPIPALSSLSSLSACSHTSWMDSGDIYKALESRPELKQWAVRVAPRCDDAGASLDITHNVSLTVECSGSCGRTMATPFPADASSPSTSAMPPPR